jgi:hypothetical protein
MLAVLSIHRIALLHRNERTWVRAASGQIQKRNASIPMAYDASPLPPISAVLRKAVLMHRYPLPPSRTVEAARDVAQAADDGESQHRIKDVEEEVWHVIPRSGAPLLVLLVPPT